MGIPIPERELICCKCNVPLEKISSNFEYMGVSFSNDVDACPSCGQVFIPYELVIGQMAETEIQLEDK